MITMAMAAHDGTPLLDALQTYVDAPSDEAAEALLSDGLTAKPVIVLRALMEIAGRHLETHGFDGARTLDARIEYVVRIALRPRNRPSRKQRKALARAAMQLGLRRTYGVLIRSARMLPIVHLDCLAGTNPYWFGDALTRASRINTERALDLALRYLGAVTAHARVASATRTTFFTDRPPSSLLLRGGLRVGGLDAPRLHAATHDAVEAWLAHTRLLAAPQAPPDHHDPQHHVLHDLALGVYASLAITNADDQRKREQLLERVAAYLAAPNADADADGCGDNNK